MRVLRSATLGRSDSALSKKTPKKLTTVRGGWWENTNGIRQTDQMTPAQKPAPTTHALTEPMPALTLEMMQAPTKPEVLCSCVKQRIEN
jgi:hypothetical protein